MRRIFRWAGWCGLWLAFATIAAAVLAERRESVSLESAVPPTGKFVNSAGVRIFIQELGPANGRAVVLIHGTGAWSEIWRETMTALASQGFRVVAIDVPPFGFSDKPAGPQSYTRRKQAARILGVLDALKIDHATLVGHSVGSRPTIEAALQQDRQRIERLVLIDAAVGFAPDLGNPQFEQNHPSLFQSSLFGSSPVRRALVALFGTNPFFTKRLFSSFVSRKDSVTESRVQMLQRPLTVTGISQAEADWLDYLMIEQDDSLSSDFLRLAELTMPTLLIWGADDQVTPLAQAYALQRLIPHSELKVIPNVGHIPYLEDPQAFNSILLPFVGAQSAPPAR